MKKVKCVDATGMERTIKVGEEYDLVKEKKNSYVIKTKFYNTKAEYAKYRFVKVEK